MDESGDLMHTPFDLMPLTPSAAIAGDPLTNPKLKEYLNRPVATLIQMDEPPLSEGMKERHRIYALLLMALVYHYWNGNKRGRRGDYPRNAEMDAEGGACLDGDYLGHNIAGLCVDRDGAVVDFDFNHNAIFGSTVEHAEARVVRRVYNLSQVNETWSSGRSGSRLGVVRSAYNTLEHVSVYTSLESCSQCAGIMALARVREVVYLQSDPGMYLIGNILRNLTRGTKLEAPAPIAGSQCDFPYFDRLNRAYADFHAAVQDPAAPPFYASPEGKEDRDPSVTSFLCTRSARDIYGEAAAEFRARVSGPGELAFPLFRPPGPDGTESETAMTNAACLSEAADFLAYAAGQGKRGTPHH